MHLTPSFGKPFVPPADRPIRPMMTTTHTLEVQPYAHDVLGGESPAAKRLRLQIARIAPYFRIALLTAEPGTGKHAVARHMHAASPMAARSFTVIAADEFAQGVRPESASGTLYLRGLEMLDPAGQVRLLRSLKSLDRDTRVILASRCDLKGMASAGRLRADLYERVGTLQIRVAPLRERLEDFDPICRNMLRLLDGDATIAEAALIPLREHAWPGNLRELWTLCERIAPLRNILDASDVEPHLPTPVRAAQSSATPRLEDVMYRHVMDVLESCSGNKLRAAELLGISRSTLYRMLGASSPA
jgi:DNA-binding NtrC family response regulator